MNNTVRIQADRGDIVIYQAEAGPSLEVRLQQESVWLTQAQMAKLFQKGTPTINEHVRNVLRTGELEGESTIRKFRIVRKEGKRLVERELDFYNLDMIIAVGYRVNSKRGTQFRIWATNVLRDHLVKGYTLNEKRLQENAQRRLKELQEAVELVRSAQEGKALSSSEAAGLLTVITEYTRSWLLLHQYDSDALPTRDLSPSIQYQIDDNEAKVLISQLKKKLIERKEAGELFGRENDRGKLNGILAGVDQTFGGHDLYPSIEEKAAHLLYICDQRSSLR
jgi:hypothetical protein